MNPAQQNKSYDGIYMLKALCAFFVVIYHVDFLYNTELKPITHIAVHVFYIISGFFLYTGYAKSEISKAKKWLKKIILWTIALNILYFIFVKKFETDISLFNIIYILFQGGVISTPLWYMTALWEALLVFIVIRCILPEKMVQFLIMTAPAAFLISLATSTYNCYIFNNSFKSLWLAMSFISVAIPCLSLGYLIGKYKEKINQFHHWGILTCSCIILAYIEFYTIGNTSAPVYFLTTLPLSACIFIFAINFNHSCRLASTIGKRDSANIYYFHMLIEHFFCYESWVNFAPAAAKMYGLVIYILCIIFSMIYHYFYSIIQSLLGLKKRIPS